MFKTAHHAAIEALRHLLSDQACTNQEWRAHRLGRREFAAPVEFGACHLAWNPGLPLELHGVLGGDIPLPAPIVDGLLGYLEGERKRLLPATFAEQGFEGWVTHTLQYGSAQPSGSSSTEPLFRHDGAIPYAQSMSNDGTNSTRKTTSFGFGERLRAARVSKGMSGTELGKGAGENGRDASKASVSDWEHERHYPKADQLRVICLKLNIAVDDLIFGDVKEHIKVIQAESAIQALSEAQRMELLARMMGPHAAPERVQHIAAAPPHDLDSRPADLEPAGAKLTRRKAIAMPKLKDILGKKKEH